MRRDLLGQYAAANYPALRETLPLPHHTTEFARTVDGRYGWVGYCKGPIPVGWAEVNYVVSESEIYTFTGEIVEDNEFAIRIWVGDTIRSFPHLGSWVRYL